MCPVFCIINWKLGIINKFLLFNYFLFIFRWHKSINIFSSLFCGQEEDRYCKLDNTRTIVKRRWLVCWPPWWPGTTLCRTVCPSRYNGGDWTPGWPEKDIANDCQRLDWSSCPELAHHRPRRCEWRGSSIQTLPQTPPTTGIRRGWNKWMNNTPVSLYVRSALPVTTLSKEYIFFHLHLILCWDSWKLQLIFSCSVKMKLAVVSKIPFVWCSHPRRCRVLCR